MADLKKCVRCIRKIQSSESHYDAIDYRDELTEEGFDTVTDIPVILAVADSLALSSATLSDAQRQAALEAIASFRALSSTFLDTAEKIIQEGAGDSAELFSTATSGANLHTNLFKVIKALWALENAEWDRRAAGIAVTGKEGRENA